MKTLLTAVVFICLGVFSVSADWPTYMFDNHRSGVSSETVDLPLNLKWKFDSSVPPAKGWAMPLNGYGAFKTKPNVGFDDAYQVIAVDGIVYFASSGANCVYALNSDSGKVLWTFFTGASPRLAPVYYKGRIYFGADDGIVYCLDAKTGDEKWRFDAAPTKEQMLGQGRFLSLWPIRSGVMIDKGVLYFTAGLFPVEGVFMYALNPEDGDVKWMCQLDKGGVGSPSPQGYMLAMENSIWTCSRNHPRPWSKKDGSNIDFNTPIPRVKDSAYRFYNGGTYAKVWNEKNIVYGKACILGFDPDEIIVNKYKKKLKGARIFNWFNTRQILFKDGLAYGANDRRLMAVDEDQLSQMSSNEFKEFEKAYKKINVASNIAKEAKYAENVAKYGKDHPWCVNYKNTTLKWRDQNWNKKWLEKEKELANKIGEKSKWITETTIVPEAMILAGDIIFLGGEKKVIAFDSKNGKNLWSQTLDNRIRGLAVSNGKLYVSTENGDVFCYGSSVFENFEKNDFYANIAKQFLKDVSKKGFCLILGAENGCLAYHISQKSSLRVVLLVDDKKKMSEIRKKLLSADLYGSRVSVRFSKMKKLPFAPYLFNLVLDENSFSGKKSPVEIDELFRVTRPYGGIAFTKQEITENDSENLKKEGADLKSDGDFMKIVRGPLPGSKNWTHHLASAANTYSSEDENIRGPFGILWYGEPGPRKRVDRHSSSQCPIVVNGIFYTSGYDTVMAYDAFNGSMLWEKCILKPYRTQASLYSGNMCANLQYLFLVCEDGKCLQMHLKTGKTVKEYKVPPKQNDSQTSFWGWLAVEKDTLLGSRLEKGKRRGRPKHQFSSEIFAYDIKTGKLKWNYEGNEIDNAGIAVSNGKIYFLDKNLTDTEKKEALANTVEDKSVPDRKNMKGKKLSPDLRKIVSLNVENGNELWTKPVNISDITIDDSVIERHHGAGCMVKDGFLVLHGIGSLGHPHRKWLKGEFKRRAIYVYDCMDGKFLWGGRKNYRKRPIIVGKYIYAEPHSWELETGEIKKIKNPLSEKKQVLDYHRGYIGCGHLLASANSIFGASKEGIGCFNLDSREGFLPFSNMTLGCGLGVAPANGVLVAPEGRSGCTCSTPILTSVVLYPLKNEKKWGFGFAGRISPVENYPVKNASVNLGAPGYREDENGKLWIPYSGKYGVGTGLTGKWIPSYKNQDEDFYQLNKDINSVQGTEIPWVFLSGYTKNKPLEFRMIDKGGEPGKYTVKLFFAEPDKNIKKGERLIDVYIQNKKVVENLDIVGESGAPLTALIKKFPGVKIKDKLKVQLKASEKSKIKKPVISALQAVAE